MVDIIVINTFFTLQQHFGNNKYDNLLLHQDLQQIFYFWQKFFSVHTTPKIKPVGPAAQTKQKPNKFLR